MLNFKNIIDSVLIDNIIYYINSLFIWLISYFLFPDFFILFVLSNLIFFGLHIMFNFSIFKDSHIMNIISYFINCIYYNILLLISDIIYIVKFIKNKRNKNEEEYKEDEDYE